MLLSAVLNRLLLVEPFRTHNCSETNNKTS